MAPCYFVATLSILLFVASQSETVDCGQTAMDCSCKNKHEPCNLACLSWRDCYDTTLTCNAGYPCNIDCAVTGKVESCNTATINSNNATHLTVLCNDWQDCRSATINCENAAICNVICQSAVPSSEICKGLTLNCGTSQCGITCGNNFESCANINVDTSTADSFQCFGSSVSCSSAPNPIQSPTNNPISFPTNNPAQSPSNKPTPSPTNKPIQSPTNKPIQSPTNNPTSSPTNNPTNNPIQSPTNNPTNNPTNIPTISPSNNPTPPPTNNPTPSPTNKPTKFPTNNPIQSPTNNPTSLPTASPTNNPTNNPTNIPTITPTNNPTPPPTNIPTISPTNNPSITPTNNPMPSPTNNPTSLPTISTTDNPTSSTMVNPTNKTSSALTIHPTNNTTHHPTTNYPMPSLTNNPTNHTISPQPITSNATLTIPTYKQSKPERIFDEIDHEPQFGDDTMPIPLPILSMIVVTVCVLCVVVISLVAMNKRRRKYIIHDRDPEPESLSIIDFERNDNVNVVPLKNGKCEYQLRNRHMHHIINSVELDSDYSDDDIGKSKTDLLQQQVIKMGTLYHGENQFTHSLLASLQNAVKNAKTHSDFEKLEDIINKMEVIIANVNDSYGQEAKTECSGNSMDLKSDREAELEVNLMSILSPLSSCGWTQLTDNMMTDVNKPHIISSSAASTITIPHIPSNLSTPKEIIAVPRFDKFCFSKSIPNFISPKGNRAS